ncbi:GNAT family N-acetyltransferase [Stackebrandtia soli]|uniref:GNAT family N-acetyltransferase n=1 Tax=Stackebrandtia soli TaxID=1892856 RepID=UPI0039E89CB7
MATEIIDNSETSRYEAIVDGQLAGFVEYERQDDFVVYPHTEVSGAFRGQGIADKLVRRAMDDMRANGDKVYALCPYVKRWLSEHDDYEDVVYHP